MTAPFPRSGFGYRDGLDDRPTGGVPQLGRWTGPVDGPFSRSPRGAESGLESGSTQTGRRFGTQTTTVPGGRVEHHELVLQCPP